MYQEKAWCDEEFLKEWISTEWGNPFKNPIGQNSDGKIMMFIVRKKTNSVFCLKITWIKTSINMLMVR